MFHSSSFVRYKERGFPPHPASDDTITAFACGWVSSIFNPHIMVR